MENTTIYKVEVITTEGHNNKRGFVKTFEMSEVHLFRTLKAAQEFATKEWYKAGNTHLNTYEYYKFGQAKNYTSAHVWITEHSTEGGDIYLYNRHCASADTWDFIHPETIFSRGLIGTPEYR